MKKISVCWIVLLLAVTMLAGCGTPVDTQVPQTDVPAIETEVPTEMIADIPAEVSTEATEESGEAIVPGGDASYGDYYVAYAEQIERYHTALSEKWDEEKYFDNGLSALPVYYYEGNPLENLGFGFVDLDNDGSMELIIGAILNVEKDPAVFEIWTLVDGAPVMLAQANSRNRYVLQYVEEDQMWYVVNEGSNSAANNATYYLMLSEGKFEVMQGIVFDALADAENPWFMTYDLDWDTSNDEPIDEATASAILESNRKLYIALEYFPYTFD